MQKISSERGFDSKRLLNTEVYILVTNYCDTACGGCNQLCPNFTKDQIFFLSVDELKWVIDILVPYRNQLIITGGEPTQHPQWQSILDLLFTYDRLSFIVMTRHNIPRIKNVYYRGDYKNPRKSDRRYYPTLLAPIDFFPSQDKDFYWQLARKFCYSWKNCPRVIYKGKSYLCEAAGAFDHLFNESHGWDLKVGENPFDKTDEQIAEQGCAFCYRCGRCVSTMKDQQKKEIGIEDQLISTQSLVSITNWKELKNHKHMSPFGFQSKML